MSKMQESVSQMSMSSGRSLLIMINVFNIMLPCVCFWHWKHFEVKLILCLFVHPSSGDGVNYCKAKYIHWPYGTASLSFLPRFSFLRVHNSCFLFVHLFQAGEGLHGQKLSLGAKLTVFFIQGGFFKIISK